MNCKCNKCMCAVCNENSKDPHFRGATSDVGLSEKTLTKQ